MAWETDGELDIGEEWDAGGGEEMIKY